MASVSKREWVGPDGEKKTAWSVRWKEADGSHGRKTFRLKKEADAYKIKIESAMADGTHLNPSQIATVKAACEAFIRFQEDRIKDGRIGRSMMIHYRNAVDVHIVPRLGTRKLDEISPIAVEQWYRDLIRSGRVSPKTAKTRVQYLKLIYEFSIRHGFVRSSPVPEALTQLRGIHAPPIRTFTLEEMRALLTALQERPHRGERRTHHFVQCAVQIAACCGLRWGEIVGLTVRNVDVEKGIIRVRHSLTRYDELKGPKTRAGNRDVALPRHVAALIALWVRDYYQDNDRGLIFRTRNGKMINHTSFGHWAWKPLLKKAGLLTDKDWHHFHALRHFHASWMIENGISLPDVASALGHSKFDTTLQVYTHAIVGRGTNMAAMQAMADRLTMAPGATLALPSP